MPEDLEETPGVGSGLWQSRITVHAASDTTQLLNNTTDCSCIVYDWAIQHACTQP